MTQSPTPGVVGFVGLGNIGKPMVLSLLRAGFKVAVRDVRADATAEAVGAGATAAASNAELATAAELIGIAVADDAQLLDLVTGSDGLAAHCKPGALLVVHSTVLPATVRTVGQALDEKGIDLLDAQISGGDLRAKEGDLAIMVGGQRETFERARDYVADDYMAAVYKLWEGSWEDDAVKADRESGVFTDPAKVHRVRHDGEFFKLDALHLAEPSVQRTPVLYQAGASGRGRRFAARHAECIFVNGPSRHIVKGYVDDLRAQIKEAGRDPADVKIFTLATPIVGRDSAEAKAKHADYLQYVSHDGALALLSGWLGIDLSRLELDDVLRHVETDAIHSVLESFTTADPDREWTVRELAEHAAIGGCSPVFVGSGADVAEEMMDWVDSTGIDGFNLAYVVMPESVTDLVELVIPELQARGRFKTAYRPGPLRRKLFGRARLATSHPAAGYRC